MTLCAESSGWTGQLELCAKSILGPYLGSARKRHVSGGKQWLATQGRSVALNSMSSPPGAQPTPCPVPSLPTNGHLSRFQVFSYVATLLYVAHAVFSLIRWKSS